MSVPSISGAGSLPPSNQNVPTSAEQNTTNRADNFVFVTLEGKRISTGSLNDPDTSKITDHPDTCTIPETDDAVDHFKRLNATLEAKVNAEDRPATSTVPTETDRL